MKPKDFFNIEGKVAFIPGGSGDLGRAIAQSMAALGARVAITSRYVEKAADITAEMEREGYEALAIGLDVKSVAEIKRATAAVVERFGALDFLINCVGIQREQPILEVSEEAYDDVYQSNLKAAMFLGQAAATYQTKAGRGGKQIHLLSVRSKLGLRGRGYSAYCSTKGGLVMLVKQHAMELAPYRINVNGVAPTFVNSSMFEPLRKDKAFLEKALARNPLGYIAEPSDVAGPVCFLCSPAADYITGQIIYVDGGITASQ